jgi:ABC-2 type transport system permease protein
MFLRIFITQLRIAFADRATVFWAMAFPLILATLFHFAFAGLNSTDMFKPVNVAVVDNASYQADTSLRSSLTALDSGDKKILSVQSVTTKDAALQLLTDTKVDGVIESDGVHSTVTVRGDVGFNETIIKTAVEQSLQTTSATTAALAHDPSATTKLGSVGATSYLHDTTNESLDRTVIYFYSLIGMACLYAGFFGIYSANRTEANLSTLGARLTVSPVSKWYALLAGLSASYVLALTGQGLLYGYLTAVLGVNFGVQVWPILLIMALGSLAGLAVGTFIGAGSKRSEIAKINTLTVGTMLCSLLAGMMGSTGLKHLIDQQAPLLAAINPVNVISDALYATYYFGIGERYWHDLLFLALFAGVAIGAAWLMTRRKTYASL